MPSFSGRHAIVRIGNGPGFVVSDWQVSFPESDGQITGFPIIELTPAELHAARDEFNARWLPPPASPPQPEEPLSLSDLRDQLDTDGAAQVDGQRRRAVRFNSEGGFTEN